MPVKSHVYERENFLHSIDIVPWLGTTISSAAEMPHTMNAFMIILLILGSEVII